jgi:hypothetical protein
MTLELNALAGLLLIAQFLQVSVPPNLALSIRRLTDPRTVAGARDGAAHAVAAAGLREPSVLDRTFWRRDLRSAGKLGGFPVGLTWV